MTELKQLSYKELEALYNQVKDMRKVVLAMVEEYGFETSQLVSQTFEREIEAEYGRKLLKIKVNMN